MIKEFMNEESGQGMAEYALIIALVGIALIAVLNKLSKGIGGVFSKTSDTLQGVSDGAATPEAIK